MEEVDLKFFSDIFIVTSKLTHGQKKAAQKKFDACLAIEYSQPDTIRINSLTSALSKIIVDCMKTALLKNVTYYSNCNNSINVNLIIHLLRAAQKWLPMMSKMGFQSRLHRFDLIWFQWKIFLGMFALVWCSFHSENSPALQKSNYLMFTLLFQYLLCFCVVLKFTCHVAYHTIPTACRYCTYTSIQVHWWKLTRLVSKFNLAIEYILKK